MKKFHRALALFLLLASLLTLASCGGSGSDTTTDAETGDINESTGSQESSDVAADTSEPTYGGSATMYFLTLSSDFDPAAPDFESYMLWYERLFTLDWSITDQSVCDFKTEVTSQYMTGQIADTWKWDADAQTFTVNIRQDIYFQTLDSQYDYYGGRNLVASDIKWSYDRVLGIGSGYTEPTFSMQDWVATLYMIDSIETEGDYTVIFHFNTGSEVAVNDFMKAAVNIAGPEWDQLDDTQKTDWHYACGTGPYILSEYSADSYMTFAKNENYYDYDERYPENKLPYLDSVTLMKVNDTATLLSQFIAGKMDIIGNNESVFSYSEAAQLRASMDASAYQEFELDITGRGICLKQTSEALSNQKVREALQYAVNLEEIAQGYFNYDKELYVPSVFTESSGFSSQDGWTQELHDSYYTYDPEKAKSLLAEAGYPDGFTFTMVYAANGDKDIYTLIQEYLAAVGVTLELEPINEMPELQAITSSYDNETCGTMNFNNTSADKMAQFWASDGDFYELCANDTELDGLVAALKTAQTLDDQQAAAQALDLYIAEMHYGLVIGPVEENSYFLSSKIGGYSGENLYVGWNASTILPRIWSETGE